MTDWRTTTLGEIVELKRGYDLPQQERRPGKVPVVSSSGITDYHADSMVRGPGVVTGRYGTIGQVFFVEEDFWPLNTTLYVRDFKGNDPRFVSYLLRLIDFSAYADKAAVPGINRNHLHQARVRCPPITEQRVMASVLGALDDKIELNRRMNETLEALARSLFKSWFVDAIRSGLPKCWHEGSILELARLLSGGTPKTDRPDYWDGDILWASAKDVSQCGQTFLVETERTITQKGLDESATQLMPPFSTVVVARGATTGRMVMFGGEMAMNQTCYALASTAGTPFALYCQLRYEMDALVHAAHGSVFDTITTSTFVASKFGIPPIELLKGFEEAASPIFHRMLTNTEESRTLAALRDALLPKLLSGELRVR